MRTLVDIPDDQIAELAEIAKQESVSRSALVRRAITDMLAARRSKKGDDVILHGLAFSPIGLRMEWRPAKAFKPYFTVMGGAIGFTKKALSPDASYYDFTLHESIGFYLKMSKKVDMRFGLFGDFHFSNAYVTSYNPGLDNMNSQLAVSYHFGG